MADKNFGVKKLDILGSGTPVIESPSGGDLNITATKTTFSGTIDTSQVRQEHSGNPSFIHLGTGGRVGVLQTSPGSALEVKGGVRSAQTPASGHIDLKHDGTNGSVTTSTGNFLFYNSNNIGDYIFHTTSSNSEKLRITSDGYVLKPNQPVFWAYRTSNYNLTTSATEMVYDTEKIDVGGNYNPSNGRFTAPVDGLYEFGYASIGHNTNTVYRYALRVNGAAPYSGMTLELRIDTNASGSEYGTNGEYVCYVNMTANQTASVYAYSDTNTNCYGNSTYGYTYFRGRLIG